MFNLKKRTKRIMSGILTFAMLVAGVQNAGITKVNATEDVDITISHTYKAYDDGDSIKTAYIRQKGNTLLWYGDVYDIVESEGYFDYGTPVYQSKVEYKNTNIAIPLGVLYEGEVMKDFSVVVGYEDGEFRSHCVKVEIYNTEYDYTFSAYYKYNKENETAWDEFELVHRNYGVYSDDIFLILKEKSSYGSAGSLLYDLGKYQSAFDSEAYDYFITAGNGEFYIHRDQGYKSFYNVGDVECESLLTATAIWGNIVDNKIIDVYDLSETGVITRSRILYESEDHYTAEVETLSGTYKALCEGYALTTDNDMVKINGLETEVFETDVTKLNDGSYVKNNTLYNMNKEEVIASIDASSLSYTTVDQGISGVINIKTNGVVKEIVTPNGDKYSDDFAYPVYESGIYVFNVKSILGNEFTLSVLMNLSGVEKTEKPTVSALNGKVTLSGEENILVSSDNASWTAYTGSFDYTDTFYTKFNSNTSRILEVSMNDNGGLIINDITEGTVTRKLANMFYITNRGTLKSLLPNEEANKFFKVNKYNELFDDNGKLITGVKSAYTRIKKYSKEGMYSTYDGGVYTYVDNNGNIFSSDYQVFEYKNEEELERNGILNAVKTFFENGYSYIIGDSGSVAKIEDEYEDSSGIYIPRGSIDVIAADGIDFSGSALVHTNADVTALNASYENSFKLEDGVIYKYNSSNSTWAPIELSSLEGTYTTESSMEFMDLAEAERSNTVSIKYREVDIPSLRSDLCINNPDKYDTLYELLEANKITKNMHVGKDENGKYFMYNWGNVGGNTEYSEDIVFDTIPEFVANNPDAIINPNDLIVETVGYGSTQKITIDINNFSWDKTDRAYEKVYITDIRGENAELLQNGRVTVSINDLNGCYKDGIVITKINYKSSHQYKTTKGITVYSYITKTTKAEASDDVFDFIENITAGRPYYELNDGNDNLIYYMKKSRSAVFNTAKETDILSDTKKTETIASSRSHNVKENGIVAVDNGSPFEIEVTVTDDRYINIPYKINDTNGQITISDAKGREIITYGRMFLDRRNTDWQSVRSPKLSAGTYTITYSGNMKVRGPEIQTFNQSSVSNFEAPYFIDYTKYTSSNTCYLENGSVETDDIYVFMDNKGYLYKCISNGSNTYIENTNIRLSEDESKPYIDINTTNYSSDSLVLTAGAESTSISVVKLYKDGSLNVSDNTNYDLYDASKKQEVIDTLLKESKISMLSTEDEYGGCFIDIYNYNKKIEDNPKLILDLLVSSYKAYAVKNSEEDKFYLANGTEISETEFDDIIDGKKFEFNYDSNGELDYVYAYLEYKYGFWHKTCTAYISELYKISDKIILSINDMQSSFEYYHYSGEEIIEAGSFGKHTLGKVEIPSNGNWTLEVGAGNGVTYSMDLKIENVDKLSPEADVVIENGKFVIKATDQDATEDYACSGIEKIEYQEATCTDGIYSYNDNDWVAYDNQELKYEKPLNNNASSFSPVTQSVSNPIVFVRATDKAGNVSEPKMVDLNGVLEMSNDIKYENGKTSVTFYAEDASEGTLFDDEKIDFKYDIDNGTVADAPNDTMTHQGEDFVLNSTSFTFTDSSKGEFTLNAYSSKNTDFGVSKQGSDSRDVVVVEVAEPTISGGDKLSITDGVVTNDTVGKTYYRYYNTSEKSNFTDETFEEYTGVKSLAPATYMVQSYTVSADKNVKGYVASREVVINGSGTEPQPPTEETTENTTEDTSEEEPEETTEETKENNEETSEEITEETEETTEDAEDETEEDTEPTDENETTSDDDEDEDFDEDEEETTENDDTDKPEPSTEEDKDLDKVQTGDNNGIKVLTIISMVSILAFIVLRKKNQDIETD